MNVREHYSAPGLVIRLRQDQHDFIVAVGAPQGATVYDVIYQYIRDGIAADKKRLARLEGS